MDDVVKQRHGCLTAWLILMIVANGLTAIATPLMITQIRQATPNFPVWVAYVIPLLAILNVVFAFAIFKWKKWGFYGFAVMAILTFCLNLYAGVGIGQALIGLIGIAVLYGVLQIGGEKKGWTQLE
jgi:hypothetical protein